MHGPQSLAMENLLQVAYDIEVEGFRTQAGSWHAVS